MDSQEPRQFPGAGAGVFYGYTVVAAAFAIMMTTFGTLSAFGVFFKPILTEFGWTRAVVSGAFSLATIIRGLLGIVVGVITDRIGPRIVLTFCGFLLGLGYLLMSQISAIWQLYLFYGVIVGIGMSGYWVPLLATVARWFAKRRSMMTGIVLAGTGLGMLVVPPVASQLISTYDWRISYVIIGSLVLVSIVVLSQFIRRDPSKIGQLPYGENREGTERVNSMGNGLSLSGAVHTRQFWLLFFIMFCAGFRMFTIMIHIVPNATDMGIPPLRAATILATIGGLGIVGRVSVGSIADRIGNRKALIIGSILMSLIVLWLPVVTDIWMFYLFAAVFGLASGVGTLSSPLAAELFGLGSLGSIYGAVNFGYTFGAAIGPFMAGYIFDVTGMYQVAFLVTAAVSIAGVILTVLLKPIKTKPGQNLEIT